MKKVLVALFAIAMMVSFSNVEAKELKIGVINLHKIISDSPQVKAISKQLKGKFKQRERKLRAQETALKAEVQKLQRDAATMKPTAAKKLQEQIYRDKRKLDQVKQDYHDDVVMAQNEAMQGFLVKVDKILKIIGKVEDFDLILQREGVPYASNKIDLTQKVLAKLDKQTN